MCCRVADATRPAKSGSDWTQNDLVAYNIKVICQDAGTFFKSPALPAPSIIPDTRRRRVAMTRKDIPFFHLRRACKNRCIDCGRTDILLIVQENERYLDDSDPEPQLFAKAIVAFSANNTPPVFALFKIIPGVIMKGTSPIFYKVHVATALTGAIALGRCPEVEPIVYAHVPSLPRPAHRWNEGMKPLDDRRLCYEAFRHFL
ncbi:hypothetical protein JOM56_005437 [Amanita muscaria]